MNAGQIVFRLIFRQLLQFLPWHNFNRRIRRCRSKPRSLLLSSPLKRLIIDIKAYAKAINYIVKMGNEINNLLILKVFFKARINDGLNAEIIETRASLFAKEIYYTQKLDFLAAFYLAARSLLREISSWFRNVEEELQVISTKSMVWNTDFTRGFSGTLLIFR